MKIWKHYKHSPSSEIIVIMVWLSILPLCSLIFSYSFYRNTWCSQQLAHVWSDHVNEATYPWKGPSFYGRVKKKELLHEGACCIWRLIPHIRSCIFVVQDIFYHIIISLHTCFSFSIKSTFWYTFSWNLFHIKCFTNYQFTKNTLTCRYKIAESTAKSSWNGMKVMDAREFP